MKPLSEWPVDRLKEWIAGGGFDPIKAVDELLRRARAEERERCAAVASESTIGMVGFTESDRVEFAVKNMAKLRDVIASHIRGLQ